MKTNQPSEEQETYWFPTTEQPGDPETYTPIQKRIYDELMELKQLEQLNPNDNEESRKNFLIISTEPTPPSAESINNILKTSWCNITISSHDIVSTLLLTESFG